MAGNDNALSSGEASDLFGGAYGYGPTSAKMAGNLLWGLGKKVAGGIWDTIKAPGEVYEGKLTPSMQPGPSQLSVPEYALNLGLNALGARGLGFAAPEGALTTFPVFHGTGARQPFHHFDDEFMGTGEGTQYEGWGHYVAEREGIGKGYRDEVGGGFDIPIDEAGIPLNHTEIAKKYFEPGSIIPAYGGNYDRVIKYNPEEPGQNWSVNVKQVGLDHAKQGAAIREAEEKSGNYKLIQSLIHEPLAHPELWTDIGGERVHATYPMEAQIEQMGHARGWDMGQSGALLHINVIPEKDEFLDLNKPWKYQEPVVKERLEKAGLSPHAIDPAYHSIREDTDIPGGILDTEVPEYMTGRDLYNSWVKQHSNIAAMEDSIRGDPTWAGDYEEPAKETVSKMFDAAGVPGFKFLDRPSRQIGPELVHNDNFNGMPGIFSVDHMLRENMSPKTFDVRDAVAHKINVLGNEAFRMESQGNWSRAQTLYRGQDWLKNELDAGNLSLGDSGRTRNFVVVNPKNLEIKTWNGRELTPVPHNPHTHTVTPVEGDPFGGQP